MKLSFQFTGLLWEGRWITPAFVEIDESGNILSISSDRPEHGLVEAVDGYALPGLPNAHSHAFQYAMAGLAELHQQHGQDDFWSWREAMYALALGLDPDHLETIAAMLYTEMLRHGYTHVVEFHYLHHDKNGKPYDNIAEMGERLLAAAQQAGIRITLIPILYQQGGFGQAPTPQQRRFLSTSLNKYHLLVEGSRRACRSYARARLGVGVHSLRAVDPYFVKELIEEASPEVPFHLHIAEQKEEVNASVAYLEKRPVSWLLDHVDLHENIHLVHCTHVNEEECVGVARSGAHVVLCPSTEGNLGDGLFPLDLFQQHGGKWSIGTDSHVGLNPFEELRLLDYGQRLATHKRTSFLSSGSSDSGFSGYHMALEGGSKAAGIRGNIGFEIGSPFDAMVIRADTPLIGSASTDTLLSTIVYASDASMYLGTIVGGTWKVREGNHLRGAGIKRRFLKVMKQVAIR